MTVPVTLPDVASRPAASARTRSTKPGVFSHGPTLFGTALLALVAIQTIAELLLRVRRNQVKVEDVFGHVTGWRLASRGGGGQLYDIATQRALQRSIRGSDADRDLLAYLYPPHLTPLFRPLARFDPQSLQRALLLINIVFAGLFMVWAGRRFRYWGRSELLLAGTFVASFLPLWYSAYRGQFATMYLLACAGLLGALEGQRWWVAGAMLLVLSWKPPIIALLLLALFVAKRTRPAVWRFGILASICSTISAWWLGPEAFTGYLRIVRATSATDGANVLTIDVMATVRSLLESWNLSAGSATSINRVVFVIGVVLSVLIFRNSKIPVAHQYATVLAVSAATSLYQYPYDLAPLLVSVAVLWDSIRLGSPRSRGLFAGVLVAANIALVSAFQVSKLGDPPVIAACALAVAWVLRVTMSCREARSLTPRALAIR